uniref:GH16 domain-containing protein n=1 Tax=Clastoptera arizonana TaxID=38151 RepID=A0A1B6C2X4_9HEMI
MKTFAVLIVISRIIFVSGVCEKSPTIANGANVCKGAVIFKDTFVNPTQFSSKWHREVKFPDDDEYEFVTYNSDEEQLYVNNSKLIIKPTLLPDDIVVRGDLKLKGCTEAPGTQHCERKAISYLIIPPVKSASVSTKNSLNFKYGIVNIRAKVPAGDWIVPQFYLKPRYYSYGPLYKSGIIRIGTVKGNQNLVCNNQSYGINYVENGVLLGDGMSVKAKTMKTFSKKPWNTQFHNYTLYWSPDEIKFSIDNLQVTKLYPDEHPVLSESVGFSPEQSEIWKQGSRIAPFDKEFYLSIGVSVGGMREFDDNCISGETYKPWKNTEVKALFKFWQNRMEWNKKTWGEKSVLEVENVVITAI